MAVDRPGRLRVGVCFDPDNDAAVVRAVRYRCRPGSGRLALAPCPEHAPTDHLMAEMLASLGVLWRLPFRLPRLQAPVTDAQLAIVEWELSWALHEAGVTEVWVLGAQWLAPLAWLWLRHTAEREGLHLVFVASGDPSSADHGAALAGCRVHQVDPARLAPSGHRGLPWWSHPLTTPPGRRVGRGSLSGGGELGPGPPASEPGPRGRRGHSGPVR